MGQAMNYCDICHAKVDPSLRSCPLCGKHLSNEPAPQRLYPTVSKRRYIDGRSLILDYLALCTLVIIGLCIIINLLTWEGKPWFLLVAAPVLYAWILVRVTIFSDLYAGIKVLLQMVGVFGLFLVFDYLSVFRGWSIEVMLPLILAGGIIVMDVFSYQHKSYWRNNLMYAILFVALGMVPLVFYLLHWTHIAWPVVLSTVASGLTVLGLFRFAIRTLKYEFVKRFHM